MADDVLIGMLIVNNGIPDSLSVPIRCLSLSLSHISQVFKRDWNCRAMHMLCILQTSNGTQVSTQLKTHSHKCNTNFKRMLQHDLSKQIYRIIYPIGDIVLCKYENCTPFIVRAHEFRRMCRVSLCALCVLWFEEHIAEV